MFHSSMLCYFFERVTTGEWSYRIDRPKSLNSQLTASSQLRTLGTYTVLMSKNSLKESSFAELLLHKLVHIVNGKILSRMTMGFRKGLLSYPLRFASSSLSYFLFTAGCPRHITSSPVRSFCYPPPFYADLFGIDRFQCESLLRVV